MRFSHTGYEKTLVRLMIQVYFNHRIKQGLGLD